MAPNNFMKTNRRCIAALVSGIKSERRIYVQLFIQAAVAYQIRYA